MYLSLTILSCDGKTLRLVAWKQNADAKKKKNKLRDVT